ncbi:MAG: hypothetical protein Q7K65_03135 [Candidatus Buchananbacteria bacterium]|nr:hypothetical protein [Candidatus Buchananbacteria bacterium]
MLIPRKIPPLLKEGRRIRKSQRESDINIVLSAFRSFRSIFPVGYLSTPITTGILFYEVLEKYGVKTMEELLATGSSLLFEEIIGPNTTSGIILGDKLAQMWRLPIIVPAVFEAKSQRWTQDDYMYVWYQVIKEMVGHTIMRDFWQYSNGGAEEFVHSVEMQFKLLLTPRISYEFPQYTPVDLFPADFADQKIEFPEKTIKITDQNKIDIRVEDGAVKITEAIIDLYQRGFRAIKLLSVLSQLVGITHCVDFHLKTGQYEKQGIHPCYEINKTAVDYYWQLALAVSRENLEEVKSS